jgi:hypothetical protein
MSGYATQPFISHTCKRLSVFPPRDRDCNHKWLHPQVVALCIRLQPQVIALCVPVWLWLHLDSLQPLLVAIPVALCIPAPRQRVQPQEAGIHATTECNHLFVRSVSTPSSRSSTSLNPTRSCICALGIPVDKRLRCITACVYVR